MKVTLNTTAINTSTSGGGDIISQIQKAKAEMSKFPAPIKLVRASIAAYPHVCQLMSELHPLAQAPIRIDPTLKDYQCELHRTDGTSELIENKPPTPASTAGKLKE